MITIFENTCVLKFYVTVLRPIFNTTYKGKKRPKYTCEIFITNWFYSYKVGFVFAMYQRMRSKETYWAGSRQEKRDNNKNGAGGGGEGLMLAKNKVLAGNSRKRRDSKDITMKSDADMAAIFGVKAGVYSPFAVVNPNSKTSTPSNGGVGRGSRERRKRNRDKKVE